MHRSGHKSAQKGECMINKRELKAAMVREGYNQTTLAERLGMSSSTLSAKLKNSSFKYSEMVSLVDILHLDDPGAIFFAEGLTKLVN